MNDVLAPFISIHRQVSGLAASGCAARGSGCVHQLAVEGFWRCQVQCLGHRKELMHQRLTGATRTE